MFSVTTKFLSPGRIRGSERGLLFLGIHYLVIVPVVRFSLMIIGGGHYVLGFKDLSFKQLPLPIPVALAPASTPKLFEPYEVLTS